MPAMAFAPTAFTMPFHASPLVFVTPPGTCAADEREWRRLQSSVYDAVAGGLRVVQVRDKQAPLKDLLASARRLRSDVPFLLVNTGEMDESKLTELAQWVDGVHFPEHVLATKCDDRLCKTLNSLGRDLTFGVSLHSVESAHRAASYRFDYVQVGTMFPTSSHPEKTQVEGVDLMRRIRDIVGTDETLVGIGGINATNAGQVLKAGADAVAVIGAIAESPDPRKAVETLLELLRGTCG